MSRIKDKKIPLWVATGHSKPITRRELLAAGMISFSASLVAPRWLDLLLPQARAQSLICPASSPMGMIPVVTLNLAGGAAMAANFIPMDEGGQPLSSYDVMGLGDGQVPLEMEFGSVPFAGRVDGVYISKFLQGLREKAPTALVNTAFIGVCVRSRDDSSENRFSIAGLLGKAGLSGSLLPHLGRKAGTFTGVGQLAAVTSPSAPLVVNGLSSLTGALGYAGALGNTLNAAQKSALAKTLSRLSEAQSRKLASSNGSEVKKLVDCSNLKNAELVALSNTGVDPRLDVKAAELNAVWGTNSGTGDTNQSLIFSAMTYNALKGNSGAAALELGGYDYHDNTRTNGDSRDLVAGQTVGQILESAAIMGKPVFVYVTSDGAVSSAKSNARNAPWTSDRGIAGAAYVLYYDPSGRKPTSSNQIGWFTNGQAASDQFVTGTNPEMAAAAVFANYLKLSDKMNLFTSLAARTLDAAQLASVVKF